MAARILDLDDESRRALEFDALLDLVAENARTELGKRRVRDLVPSADPGDVHRRLELVRETQGFVDACGRLVAGALPDPEPALRLLEIEGTRVEPTDLHGLATVATAAANLRDRIAEGGQARFPLLDEIGNDIPDLGGLADEVLTSIEPDGRIADTASPELRRIRHAAARVGERLRRMLEGILHRRDTRAAIQDEFVTQRNGRFVVPVRSEGARSVRGIVHATSSSGATVFVEPMESVELNNDLVRLGDAEVEEQDRIVGRWTAGFRSRFDDVRRAVDTVARVDAIQACALFAERHDARFPVLDPGGILDLADIRHPLLDRQLRSTGGLCVPIGLRLDPADQVLVISGPNTGGKTVALKTLGLAVLMTQSGIPLMAANARVPVFRQLRTDIGDHQSLEANLSTFSAHLDAVRRFMEDISCPAVFLFDEIGTGTDPAEGAALARAILERLAVPGLTTVATTHHGTLKAWAFSTPGVASAALEFDRESLAPTFRIRMDSAGVSAGLDIAERLGLDGAVVQRARELLGEGGRQAEEYLHRLRGLTSELEAQEDALTVARREVERDRERQREVASRQLEELRRHAERRLQDALKRFHERRQRELETIRDDREREFVRKAHRRSESRLAAQIARATDSIGRHARPETERPSSRTGPVIEPGQRVRVRSLDREGEIVRVRGEKVEVRLGAVGFTVERGDLEPPGAASVPTPGRSEDPGAASSPRSRLPVRNDLGDELPRELHLIGKTVDEALPVLDKFLDTAALGALAEIRVVHGHGTGRLRNAVRAFLDGHPHVRRHRAGAKYEGGDGATVVELR